MKFKGGKEGEGVCAPRTHTRGQARSSTLSSMSVSFLKVSGRPAAIAWIASMEGSRGENSPEFDSGWGCHSNDVCNILGVVEPLSLCPQSDCGCFMQNIIVEESVSILL